MNKEKLLEVKTDLENHTDYYSYSDDAQQALEDMISQAIDQDGVEDFTDTFYETTNDTFMYYNDAWDYMRRYGDTDLGDAVREGFTDICSIAWYNLEQEFYDLLRDANLKTEDFEK